MEHKILFDLIHTSIVGLWNNEHSLLERNLHEQTITFRLGLYINELYNLQKNHLTAIYKGIENAFVDAEYNKCGSNKKYIYKNCIEKRCIFNSKDNCFIKSWKWPSFNISGCSFIQNEGNEKEFRPDLLLHVRNNNFMNFIAIELKKRKNDDPREYDFCKLSYLTCDKSEYNFLIGIHIDISENDVIYTIFENGKIVDSMKFHFKIKRFDC